jgi:dienelactone hydrolase
MRHTTRASCLLASRQTIWAQIFALLAIALMLPACSDSTSGNDAADATTTQDTSGDGVATDAATDISPSALSRLPAPRTLSFCAGSTTSRYAPLSSETLDVFPDDFWSVEDPTTATGRRLHVTNDTPWLGWMPGNFQSAFLDLSALDGFGINASLFQRFDAAIAPTPSGPDTAKTAPAGVELWALPADAAPVRIPFEATLTDDGETVLLAPMLPLRARTAHIMLVRSSQNDAKGGCLQPSSATRALLERTIDTTLPTEQREQLAALALRWDAALQAIDVPAAEIASMAVFTTQAPIATSLTIAADIRGRDVSWKAATCSEPKNKAWRLCEVPFDAWDYRDGYHIKGLQGVTLRTHVARVWLPKTGKGPFPTVIFGHGLTGSRSQGDKLADFGAPKGIAAIAIDAVFHGEHPAGSAKSLGGVFGFFGVDVATLSFDFLRLRDNFRESTFESLQLIEAIRRHPDVDGDGQADFDPQALGYLGVSLGGIMGPALLALSGELHGAVLSVPGGKTTSIIESSDQFKPIITAFKPDNSSDGDVARFFCVLQTLIDAGDAASYAPHVLRDRLEGAGTKAPEVLIQMAMADDIVPNVATRALIRALGVPVVGPVLQSVGIVEEGVPLPVQANIQGSTGGAFQFDRVRKNSGAKVEKADHSGTPACFEAMTQDLHFFETWLSSGHGEIIDPYLATGTGPLP